MNNTYRDIEVIVVDDGSIDDSVDIVNEFIQAHDNVRLIRHEENKGLFEARLTGFRASHGDYIAFVDADDYVSLDWFRMLHEAITENCADIAVGQFILDYGNGNMTYDNLDPLRQAITLEEDEVMRAFMHNQGKHYSFQLVWNKLYKRELWIDALATLEEFSKKAPKLIMCEDIAFSVSLWARAKKVVNFTYGALYYYFKHSGQSTDVESHKAKNTRNIKSVGCVFDYFEGVLKSFNIFEKYKTDFNEWKLDYANLYFNQLSKFNKRYYLGLIEDSFNLSKLQISAERPYNAMYAVSTPVDPDVLSWSNSIKAGIKDECVDAVSFDIFDTLIVRPFAKPEDLLRLLNAYFYKVFNINSYYNFKEIRVNAERRARSTKSVGSFCNEEVTLDEIYEQIAIDYGFDKEKLEIIKEKETELEIKLCYKRKYGYQLFRLAQYMGKKIYLTSDMYLPREVIERILEKNGYSGYTALYLSSEIGLTKQSTNLFRYLLKKEKLNAGRVLHIGDNWESDALNPKKIGIKTFHLPATSDIFFSRYSGIYGGEIITRARAYSAIHDLGSCESYFTGYSAMIGIIANKLFDCPYVQYNRNTDFNSDPFIIGYSALGPYLYAITDWILKTAVGEGAKKVHFVARDGYLPMRAFEIFKKYINTHVDSNYLYVSRKSMLLADIYTASDVYSLTYKINSTSYTPNKVIELFKPYLKQNANISSLDIDAAFFDIPFKISLDFEKFVNKLYGLCDEKKLSDYKEKLACYFSDIIKPTDMLFDIGYSGRQESALSKLLGFSINGMYIHSNNEILNERMKIGEFYTKTFYDKKPQITGVIREHVFMKLAPSTIGYREINGTLEPVFDKMKLDRASEIITETMQGAALQFVNDFLALLGEHLDSLYYRKDDFTYTFEYYLQHSRYEDKKVFSGLIFEDELGEGKKLCALDFWNEHCSNIGVNSLSLANGTHSTNQNNTGVLRRLADVLLPKGTRRREWVKKAVSRLIR